MSGTSTVLLEHHLKALKLPTISRGYPSVAMSCAAEKADYATYLLRLAERELIERERKAAERRLKEAGFPVVKTLETFQFAACPSINEALVRLLIRGDYLEKKENILLVGNPGTGKSHLATALSRGRLPGRPAGEVHLRERAGHADAGSARTTHPATAAKTTRPAASGDPRRTRLRAVYQSRRGAAFRRGQPRR